MKQVFKKKRWDRKDGWRLSSDDPVLSLVPFVMTTRLDSQNYFEEEMQMDHLDEFVKKYSEEIPGLSIMYVLMAAMVRLFSQRPYINRFVVHNKIFARNNISICVTIKRNLSDKGKEAVIKTEFEPTDTLYDVVRKVEEEIAKTAPTEEGNSTDKVARVLDKIPTFVKRGLIRFLMWLDDIDKFPAALTLASPWHTSCYITNVGSLGIGAIYHHLYKFGTCSIFVGMGKKHRVSVLDEGGSVKTQKRMGFKYVTDERICDGHYYALSMRYLKKLLASPEKLLVPPKSVVYDDLVKSPRKEPLEAAEAAEE